MSNCVRITTAENGYVLEYEDPEVRKKNRDNCCPWEDPWKQRVYDTPEALAADLVRVLPIMKEQGKEAMEPAEEFKTALSQAFKETDE